MRDGFELPAAGRRRFHLETGAQYPFEFLLYVLDAHAVFYGEVDAIESAPAPENFLRGVNIHDGEIAAKGAGESAGLHDAADREEPFALHRTHGNSTADGKLILSRECIGDDE